MQLAAFGGSFCARSQSWCAGFLLVGILRIVIREWYTRLVKGSKTTKRGFLASHALPGVSARSPGMRGTHCSVEGRGE